MIDFQNNLPDKIQNLLNSDDLSLKIKSICDKHKLLDSEFDYIIFLLAGTLSADFSINDFQEKISESDIYPEAINEILKFTKQEVFPAILNDLRRIKEEKEDRSFFTESREKDFNLNSSKTDFQTNKKTKTNKDDPYLEKI